MAAATAWLLSTILAATTGATASDPSESGLFADVTAQTGLDFVHWNGMNGELYYAEMMGSGVALVDYDGDGDLDAFLLQGAPLAPPGGPPPALPPPAHGLGNRLYRNDLSTSAGGAAQPRFRDVTATSGDGGAGYGMAVATGDADGDGDVDLFVGNLGRDQLLSNRGDGSFADVTERAGVGDAPWTSAATFFDYDGDGALDLYVARYVVFDPARNVLCYAETSRRDYCGPDAFPSLTDSLFHNRGDGTFEDVTLRSGIGAVAGPALGVVATDFDGDRRPDVYVANDGKANFLFLNRGDGTFREDALFCGAALDAGGRPQASMGIVVADLDEDGDQDLYLTHLAAETDALYVNDGRALFTDRSVESGLGPLTLPATSFGSVAIDVDLDGWLDLVVTSGAVRILADQAAAGVPLPLAERGALWHGRGGGAFEDWRDRAGEAVTSPRVGRGLAAGDLDEDGRPDLLLGVNGGAARLLRNRSTGGRWLGARVLGPHGADAIGAEVKVALGGGRAAHRRIHSDGSYASASDARAVVALPSGDVIGGDAVGGDDPPILDVRWPDGRRRRVVGAPAGRYSVLTYRGAFDP